MIINIRKYLLPGLIALLFGATMLAYRLEEVPPLWFDEGWTLTVARNWFETGQYARLLQGSPISAVGMSKSLSIITPTVLSFYLFGVGVWQGRLPEVLAMALALYCIFQLSRKLFSLRVAYLTLFVLIFMASPINPWIIGREAIAEAPMVLFLTAGFLLLLASLNMGKYFLLGAILFWGLALDTKWHVLPFLSAALLLPMLILFIRKQWLLFKQFGLALIGSFLVFFLLQGMQKILYDDYPLYEGAVRGFYSLNVFTINSIVRTFTFGNVIIFGIPVVVGIVYGITRCWQEYKQNPLDYTFYVRLSVLTLALSWLSWFALLSLGWSRYFFPVFFFGSIFIATWMDNFLEKTNQMLSGEFKHDIWSRSKVYICLFIIVYAISLNFALLRQQIINGNNDVYKVAQFIKLNIGNDALLETYESEFLFLLDNPFHYPADQVQFDLNRRQYLNENINITYDPSNVNYRYLIDGPMSKMWQLYTPILEKDDFELLYDTGRYQVYKNISAK